MTDIFQIPAEMWKAETRTNNAVKLTFLSQENVSSEALKRVFEWRGKTGWLLFLVRENKVNADEVLALDLPETGPIEKDDKSPSQRMRAVMYRAWEQNKRGYDDFNLYYLARMEKIINHIKEELA